MVSSYNWRRPEVLSQTMKARLDRLPDMARQYAKPSAPAAVLGISVATLKQTLYHLTGSSAWPPVLEPWLFDLPVEAVDDEAESVATIRAKLRHWLKATNTADKDFAQVCQTGAVRVRGFVDGVDDLNPALIGRVLMKMRNAPWGYSLGKKRSMPLTDAGGHVDRPFGSVDELQARIEADQAQRRAERERWLDIEQQKYRLTKRGRLPEEMAA